MCVLHFTLQDPHLRNLESRFALQQKIVEAAIKLSNEEDLCKTVKKKRRNNYLDAMRKLEEIEKEINAYRIKKGKKPTQRASLILAGTQISHTHKCDAILYPHINTWNRKPQCKDSITKCIIGGVSEDHFFSLLLSDDVNPSDLSSLSDSLTLDDGKCSGIVMCTFVNPLLFLLHLPSFIQSILTKLLFLISQTTSLAPRGSDRGQSSIPRDPTTLKLWTSITTKTEEPPPTTSTQTAGIQSAPKPNINICKRVSLPVVCMDGASTDL